MLKKGVFEGVGCTVDIGRESVKGSWSCGVLVPLLGRPFHGRWRDLQQFGLVPIVSPGRGLGGVNPFEGVIGITPVVVWELRYV